MRLTLHPVHEVGVFTTAALKKHSKPRFIGNDWRLVPMGRVRSHLLRYCVDAGNGRVYCPREPHHMCLSWYVNHSATPNVDARTWRTLRYVRAGEELTIDYNVLEEHT